MIDHLTENAEALWKIIVPTKIFKYFFSSAGRVNRSGFWAILIPFWALFWILFFALESSFGPGSTLPLSMIFLVSAFFLCARRLHDRDKSAWWMLLLLIPVIGPVFIFIELALLKGTIGDNRFGDDPAQLFNDYLSVK
jgi:uncharacterized membrane protein YhaH (DUF805 family)